ncbi:hypothetical protein [Polaribacter sp. L3A8]|uniref:hypothetical protein n=1 Tax=Polaribacter sp. L3A8 TaxID=2686361 RepID=UPI00131DD5E8|nr:hypothetical protein [Polaribacter sp. L3A8]
MDLKINWNTFIIGGVLILLLIAISFLVGNFGLVSILSTVRGYFYMLVFFSIFKDKKINNFSYILFISLGSVFGWLLDSLLFVNMLANDMAEGKTIAVYGNMITLSLAMSIPFFFKQKKYIVIAFLSGLILSLSTGTRRQIIIFIISFGLSLMLTMKISINGIIKKIITLGVITSFLVILYPLADEYVYNVSPTLHYRIFTKTEQLFTGEENDSDDIRTNAISEFVDTYEEYVFPRGFVSKRTMTDADTGKYMDSPYYELFYTFSLAGVLFILLLLVRRFFFHLNNYLFKGGTESGVCMVSIATIFVLIMVEGSFLNWSYTTPCTGFVLARIFSSKNLIKI